MGYSFRLAARVLLYAWPQRQDNTYHDICYTSRGALAGTRNISMRPLWRIDPTTYRTISERSYHGAPERMYSYNCTSQHIQFICLYVCLLLFLFLFSNYNRNVLLHHSVCRDIWKGRVSWSTGVQASRASGTSSHVLDFPSTRQQHAGKWNSFLFLFHCLFVCLLICLIVVFFKSVPLAASACILFNYGNCSCFCVL